MTPQTALELPVIPNGYSLHKLSEEDYYKGALNVLAQLTSVGEVSIESFKEFVTLQKDEIYNTIVIRNENDKVCGIATLLVETKLIHGFSKVGHIEDVAVDSSIRGANLGMYMIRYLCNKAIEIGCYKVILDCDVENVGFYEKCGLLKRGIEMEYR
jgi:glucosamine-phosphate N-acetyltransferase